MKPDKPDHEKRKAFGTAACRTTLFTIYITPNIAVESVLVSSVYGVCELDCPSAIVIYSPFGPDACACSIYFKGFLFVFGRNDGPEFLS